MSEDSYHGTVVSLTDAWRIVGGRVRACDKERLGGVGEIGPAAAVAQVVCSFGEEGLMEGRCKPIRCASKSPCKLCTTYFLVGLFFIVTNSLSKIASLQVLPLPLVLLLLPFSKEDLRMTLGEFASNPGMPPHARSIVESVCTSRAAQRRKLERKT